MFSDRLALQIAEKAQTASISQSGMLALVEVETNGDPFEADSRTPSFLFERHVFYRELSAHQPGKLAQAVKAGLALTHWTPATQYKDEGTSEHRMALLARAVAIDEECAKRSASWGLPQVMGNECAEVGFPNAIALVRFLTDGGVNAHLEVMVRLIRAKRLVSAIAEKDWATVALRYNGKGYRKNNYDTRLSAADRKWERKLPSLAVSGGMPPAPEELLSRDEVKAIQTELRGLGYTEVGLPDGRWGSKTTGAISAFQTHEGLPLTGHYDPATKQALSEADARPVEPERAAATMDDLRDLGSTTVARADNAETAGKLKVVGGSAIGIGAVAEQATTALGGAQDTVDRFGQAKTLWGSIHDMAQPVLGHPIVIVLAIVLIVAGYFVIRYARQIKTARLEDHQTGVHAGTLDVE